MCFRNGFKCLYTALNRECTLNSSNVIKGIHAIHFWEKYNRLDTSHQEASAILSNTACFIFQTTDFTRPSSLIKRAGTIMTPMIIKVLEFSRELKTLFT